MTRAQRAQVVELLRAAATRGGGIAEAHQHCTGVGVWMSRAAHPVWDYAIKARVTADSDDLSYEDTCRIAAARVEQGEWP